MCAAILQQVAPVLATQGNLNNEIGVPNLTAVNAGRALCRGELGANHPGEIAWTTSLVKPDVAVINNVAAAHLAGFGSLRGVAVAKTEILAVYLPRVPPLSTQTASSMTGGENPIGTHAG